MARREHGYNRESESRIEEQQQPFEPTVEDSAASPDPESSTPGEPTQQRVAVTPKPSFNRQLVVDLDFSVTNPIPVIHSMGSANLFVSMINISAAPGDAIPAVAFTDTNTVTVKAAAGTGQWRLYITVVP